MRSSTSNCIAVDKETYQDVPTFSSESASGRRILLPGGDTHAFIDTYRK